MAGAAVAKFLWYTPLLTLSLGHDEIGRGFPQALAAQARELHGRFLRDPSRPELLAEVCTDDQACGGDAASNDAFFEFQKQHGAAFWAGVEAFGELQRHMLDAVTKLQTNTGGRSGHPRAPRADELFCWCSVHRSGSWHRQHTHASAFSAVFFAEAPPGSGGLVFSDPRGPLPPFGNTLTVLPVPGDIVVFPGWLAHVVEPSTFAHPDDTRVSFSCNVPHPDGWTGTADLNVEFGV